MPGGFAAGCAGGGRRHGYTRLKDPRQGFPQSVLVYTVALLCGAAAVTKLLMSGRVVSSASEITEKLSQENADKGVRITVKNDYSSYVGRVQQEQRAQNAYSYEHLAEPFRATTLRVEEWYCLNETTEFRWEVDGVFIGVGASLETSFETIGTFKCSVTAYAHDDQAEPSSTAHQASHLRSTGEVHSFELTVKYVRREIRDLTDRDRETFLNAVSVLQRVPSAVGREIYGDKYYSKDYFNRLHLYAGADPTCDHWHDGPGFSTAHMALTLMYEQALQAVNPSIAIPYWDFTVEGTLFDWSNFRSSSIFSDDWFGAAAPQNEARVLDRGRFAFVPVMANASQYSGPTMRNSYGLLRSPWNSDPTPFITRSDRLFGYSNNRKPAGCKQYRDAFRHNDWMSLSEALRTDAHGHIHEILGGTWSAEAGAIANRTTDLILPFLHDLQILTKKLWRAGYLVCPDSCGVRTPWAECHCTCDSDAIAGKSPYEILEDAGVSGSFFYDQDLKKIESLQATGGEEEDNALAARTIPGYTDQESEDIFTEALHVTCTPARVGTSYEATSTNDPIFWVIHTPIERLWHFRRLQGEDRFDDTWVTSESVCYGDNPDDIQPFSNLFKSQQPARIAEDEGTTAASRSSSATRTRGRGSGDGRAGGARGFGTRRDGGVDVRTGSVAPPKEYYTNTELYQLLKPDGEAMPYAYDNFEWPHCDAIGVHIS